MTPWTLSSAADLSVDMVIERPRGGDQAFRVGQLMYYRRFRATESRRFEGRYGAGTRLWGICDGYGLAELVELVQQGHVLKQGRADSRREPMTSRGSVAAESLKQGVE